jgi:hypothetical protein
LHCSPPPDAPPVEGPGIRLSRTQLRCTGWTRRGISQLPPIYSSYRVSQPPSFQATPPFSRGRVRIQQYGPAGAAVRRVTFQSRAETCLELETGCQFRRAEEWRVRVWMLRRERWARREVAAWQLASAWWVQWSKGGLVIQWFVAARYNYRYFFLVVLVSDRSFVVASLYCGTCGSVVWDVLCNIRGGGEERRGHYTWKPIWSCPKGMLHCHVLELQQFKGFLPFSFFVDYWFWGGVLFSFLFSPLFPSFWFLVNNFSRRFLKFVLASQQVRWQSGF